MANVGSRNNPPSDSPTKHRDYTEPRTEVTPLHKSCARRRTDVVSLLLQYNANPNCEGQWTTHFSARPDP